MPAARPIGRTFPSACAPPQPRRIVRALALSLAATFARAQDGTPVEPRDPPREDAANLKEDAATLPPARLSDLPLADACAAVLRGQLAPADVPGDLPGRCERLIRQGAAASASVGGRGSRAAPRGSPCAPRSRRRATR